MGSRCYTKPDKRCLLIAGVTSQNAPLTHRYRSKKLNPRISEVVQLFVCLLYLEEGGGPSKRPGDAVRYASHTVAGCHAHRDAGGPGGGALGGVNSQGSDNTLPVPVGHCLPEGRCRSEGSSCMHCRLLFVLYSADQDVSECSPRHRCKREYAGRKAAQQGRPSAEWCVWL